MELFDYASSGHIPSRQRRTATRQSHRWSEVATPREVSMASYDVRTAGIRFPLSGLLTGVLVASAMFTAAAYLVALGEHARVEEQRETAAEIAQEDAAFCAKFGAGPSTGAFASCVQELAQVRQRQDERSFAQADL